MMELSLKMEGSFLYLHPHLAVSVTERNTFLHQAVHFLYAEGLLVKGIVHEAAVHFHAGEGKEEHVQAAVQLPDSVNALIFPTTRSVPSSRITRSLTRILSG